MTNLPPEISQWLNRAHILMGTRRGKYVLNALLLTVILLFVTNAFIGRGDPSALKESATTPGLQPGIAMVPDDVANVEIEDGIEGPGDRINEIKAEEEKQAAAEAAAAAAEEAGVPPPPVEADEPEDAASDHIRAPPAFLDPEMDWALSMAESEQEKEYIGQIYSQNWNDPQGERLVLGRQYYRGIFKTLRAGEPITEKVTRTDDKKVENVGVDSVGDSPALTKEYLETFISLSDDQMSKLTAAHQLVKDNLPDKYLSSLYQGTGIVYVGGGAFNWYALLSIKNLRKIGCTLPIEVIIPALDEYEPELCERVFPAYGAHCVYLPKVLGRDAYSEFLFQGYQYKGLALLVSSFENVLLLDADNVPVANPETMFTSEPFKSTGMVIWPDFWKRTTSPYWYDIAGVKVDETVRRDFGYQKYGKYITPNAPEGYTLYHQYEGTLPDPSSESGQMMVNKRMHTKDVMLALYYNMYGPEYYYPLFSQGAAGEGDKETFIAGAHVLNRPYYQVKQMVKPIGRFRGNVFHGSAMGQSNPKEDYELGVEYAQSTEEVKEEPSLMFMHINFPKLDPIKQRENGIIYDKETGERNRMFGEEFIDIAKYDFELVQYRSMKIFACDLGIPFKFFEKKGVSREDLCKEINDQLEYLKKTTRKPLDQQHEA